ncbi:hypothetical protein H2198_003580 [Neophaeococcomyces mojaviensis]|uniref:Uncharacterized protein n=1 Tax=Neophaeococcomyces mojaviensis TaxID=3383035 RepID=A0ACC3AB37_9EURO|nr:hypothetical protein H2198_003580 [Knufia sp. JES_112]
MTSSQSPSSATASFLGLPNEIRNRIYKTVLTISHPIHLFQDPGSAVASFAPDRPPHWLAILHTNRQIHAESSAILYTENHFHFVDITGQQVVVLRSFLDRIGSTNAASLSHLCINFPVAESMDDQPGSVRLKDHSLQSLQLLQDRCTNLSTLETLVHHKNSRFFTRTDDFLREAFSQIDAQLKAIHSLKRVIVRVEVDDNIPMTPARDLMQRVWMASLVWQE